jgi:hypothetical protein
MRRRIRAAVILTICSLGFVLALPAARITAACAPLPSASSAEGIQIMRTTEIIAVGTIDGSSVPADAHGGFSFFMNVRGYFQGAGPARIEVSDYGDGDMPATATTPGSSAEASQTFIDRFGGQDAIIFAYQEEAPYTNEYAVNGCTYTAYGDAAAGDIQPFVRNVFGAPEPPVLSATGPRALPALLLAAALLVCAGAALRASSRVEIVVRRARSR